MKFLILGSNGVVDDTESHYAKYIDFFERGTFQTGQPVDAVFTLVEDLYIKVGDGIFSIFDTRNNVELNEYGAVFIRSKIKDQHDTVSTICMYMTENNMPIINDYSSFQSHSKLNQAARMHTLGLPVAQTILVTPALLERSQDIPFGYPCIMKATLGSHGKDNHRINKPSEILDVIERDENKLKYVLQRFMPNDGDFRILIAGEHQLIIKRYAVGDSHLNNTSQGGRSELVDSRSLPPEVIEQARALARASGLLIAGVDAVYDKSRNEYSFLEVNYQPQLKTGAFVVEKERLIAEFLADLNAQDA